MSADGSPPEGLSEAWDGQETRWPLGLVGIGLWGSQAGGVGWGLERSPWRGRCGGGRLHADWKAAGQRAIPGLPVGPETAHRLCGCLRENNPSVVFVPLPRWPGAGFLFFPLWVPSSRPPPVWHGVWRG